MLSLQDEVKTWTAESEKVYQALKDEEAKSGQSMEVYKKQVEELSHSSSAQNLQTESLRADLVRFSLYLNTLLTLDPTANYDLNVTNFPFPIYASKAYATTPIEKFCACPQIRIRDVWRSKI